MSWDNDEIERQRIEGACSSCIKLRVENAQLRADMQEIMRINNGLREALLEVGNIVNKTVR